MKFLLTSCLGIAIVFMALCAVAQPQQSAPADGKGQPQQAAPSPTAKTAQAKSDPAKSDSARANSARADFARSDSAKAGLSDPGPATDDMPFALIAAVAFLSLALGGAIIGAFAATLFLIALLALVSAGILSAGILYGLHKRSVAAGFKTLLLIVCSLGGIVAGAGGFWLIHRFFHIHMTTQTSVLLGAVAGLLGGLLLGIVLFGLIRAFLEYCRKKLSLKL